MPQLTDRCEVWRMVGAYDAGKTLQMVYRRVPCLRVPISNFDSLPEFARESTDLFILPTYLTILKDDELHRGRRIDVTGNPVQYRYSIDGVRNYDGFGLRHLEVFARTKD